MTTTHLARTLAADAEAIDEACAVLGRGGLVAVPTETVYGLAANALDGNAVARIFEAKGRPSFNPLIVHVTGRAMATELAAFGEIETRLADAFWPGPLTLVLPAHPDCTASPLVRAGLATLALRSPIGWTNDLIGRCGFPIAAPSANRSGRVTGTDAPSVCRELGERIDLIIDGGPSQLGVESTIVAVADGAINILRPGGITAEELTGLGVPVRYAQDERTISAPGMMTSHYAPNARLRLNAASVERGEALIAFGPHRITNAEAASPLYNLSETGDLRGAAAILFQTLRALDESGVERAAVEPIPTSGLGIAINDRLRRAAAPRND